MQTFLGKKKRNLNIELKILIPSIVISIVGLVALLSTTILPDGTFSDISVVGKQFAFIITGYLLYFVISKTDLSYSKCWQIILSLYLLTLLSLIAVLFFGPTINNVKRWLVVGGIQLQPSEFAKITIIFLTAYILSWKVKYNQWVLFVVSLLLILPIFFLTYFQPDGSMSILLLAIWFFVAFTGLDDQFRNSISIFIVVLGIFGFLLASILSSAIWLVLVIISFIIAIFAYFYRDSWRVFVVISFLISIVLGLSSSVVWESVLRDYQRDRIEVYLNPTQDIGDTGFNVNQARIAIGSGQIWGKGFGNGTQSKRNFLPEHQTDFIFASFAEEFGLIGTIFLIILFAVIILTGFNKTMLLTNNPYFAMIVLGFTVKLLLEVFINIATNTGAIPATGIPLPLVSAGGSVTLVTLFSLGVIQSIIARHAKVDDTSDIIRSYEV
ncbi:rod shape-determining protein RodA [bacterium]|nr:rod shape-determining protein RodA [bacterium]